VRGGTLVGHLLGEQVFEFFAVFEIHRDVEVAGNVRLGDVELLQQGGEEFAGMKLGSFRA
jgi:hypothetical protein